MARSATRNSWSTSTTCCPVAPSPTCSRGRSTTGSSAESETRPRLRATQMTAMGSSHSSSTRCGRTFTTSCATLPLATISASVAVSSLLSSAAWLWTSSWRGRVTPWMVWRGASSSIWSIPVTFRTRRCWRRSPPTWPRCTFPSMRPTGSSWSRSAATTTRRRSRSWSSSTSTLRCSESVRALCLATASVSRGAWPSWSRCSRRWRA
mmetsp:Transcript_25508/g.75953  ORF Transcript_25508/g.75953 Transcript_25508/m.75953 type:complete len:207 (-) Transcript_25508:1131-1751(-)